MDWAKEIVVMVAVKQAIFSLDGGQLYPHHLPGAGAKAEEIVLVEKKLGGEIDAQYKEFLSNSNGWKAFYLTADLFGTKDLLGSDKFNEAMRWRDQIFSDQAEPLGKGVKKENVLPISYSDESVDIFLIENSVSVNPGKVHWHYSGGHEEYSSFNEYYLTMVDYGRHAYQYLKDQK